MAEENNAKTLPPSPTEQNSSSEIQTPQHAQTEPSPLSFNLYGTFEEDENDPSHCELHVNIPPPIKTLPPSKTLPSSFPGIQTPQQIQTEPPPLSFDLYDAFEEDDLSQNPFEKYAPKNLPLGKNILPHS
ncbi:MAG: hypothetical protein FWB81_03785, partial [Cystobacterineae bacterium]|nr:hypothetical protein [Cystobacterineae bacterium]